MNQFPVKNSLWLRTRRRIWLIRQMRYFWIGIISYSVIIAAVLVYLARPPVYSSSMSLVLPGSGTTSNFSIDEVGQANQSTLTPFGSAAFSPLVNYKEIIRGREVQKGILTRMSLSKQAIKGVRTELIERTSILHVYFDSNSPGLAQEISWAAYNEFQSVLERLRNDELTRRDQSILSAINHYREKVAQSRKAILEFQERSLLVSQEQVVQLTANVSSLNEKILNLQSQASHKTNFVHQMGSDLRISPAMAGQAFALQSDASFRGYLSELYDSATLRSEYSSRWGQKHPKVIAQTMRYDSAREALITRGEEVVGPAIRDALHAMDLQSSPDRAKLFAKLVDEFATLQGIKAEIDELQRNHLQMSDRLKIFSRESSELERLQRDHDLAEAVYTSAAAKLEAGKSDIFASYPPVQLLSTPNLPEKPKSPNVKIAIALGGIGIILISIGLIALWHRKYFIDLLLKSE